MIEVFDNLFVGNQDDYEFGVRQKNDWAVVHACKEPYHRKALGYTGKGAPKDNPEYLIAHRGDRLILNLVDVDNVEWISPIIIDQTIIFINEKLREEKKLLIHCNQGMSRSASIALLFLASRGAYSGKDFLLAEFEFKSIYPKYCPAKGIRDYMINNWSKYCI